MYHKLGVLRKLPGGNLGKLLGNWRFRGTICGKFDKKGIEMVTNVLWYDDRKGVDFVSKFRTGAKAFMTENGVLPAACHINPRMKPEGIDGVDGVEIVTKRYVLMDYFLFSGAAIPSDLEDTDDSK